MGGALPGAVAQFHQQRCHCNSRPTGALWPSLSVVFQRTRSERYIQALQPCRNVFFGTSGILATLLADVTEWRVAVSG